MSRRPTPLPRVRPHDVPALLAALVAAVVVEVGLRTTTLPRLARALGAPLVLDPTEEPTGRGPVAPLPERALRDMDAARRVLRHRPFHDTCLRQALVCGCLLRRFGPRLQLGVARIDGAVRAHAWLVVDGVVVDPRRAVSFYQPLTTVRAG